MSVTRRCLGPRIAKSLYDEAQSGFWLRSFITWPSPLSDEKVAAESISRNNRRPKLPVRAAGSAEEGWQSGCGLTTAAMIFSIAPLCSEPPFTLALAKMHSGCVRSLRKDRPVAAVPGQWSAKEEQVKQRGTRRLSK